ncbi:hypothetical protein AVEN_106921-1 [Araneus ventricosus]|uniref:Uncharacterized protein n=1 Tax=Araneus ventricosus TaxID=182803 RepID=A0A4Y2NPV6_ARAVE|nr:hypothetical protein AVEN_106921-1 [Araneus ventricosus]
MRKLATQTDATNTIINRLSVEQLTSSYCEPELNEIIKDIPRFSGLGIYSFPTRRDVIWNIPEEASYFVPNRNRAIILPYSRTLFYHQSKSKFFRQDGRQGQSH